MAKQQKKDHVPPEREIVDNVALIQGEIEGTDRIIRYGARYSMACHCGNYRTTFDDTEVTKFMKEHLENCTE